MRIATHIHSVACATLAATCLLIGQASATVVRSVSMSFQSGAMFTGTVTFADDYSSVLDVNGILTGYQYGTFGYQGSGSDTINWIWSNGDNYSSGAGNYSTYLMDGPGSGYTSASYSNWIEFAYNYSSAPILTFTAGASGDGYDNFIDYVDPMVSGNIGATPLPAALPLFASGLGGLGFLGWRRKRKAAARAA